RRHTRSKRDWSSDVCSSDLVTTRHHSPAYVSFGKLYLALLYPMHGPGVIFPSHLGVESQWYMALYQDHQLLRNNYLVTKSHNDLVRLLVDYTLMIMHFVVVHSMFEHSQLQTVF